MASNIIEALFAAKETISDALDSAGRASNEFQSDLGALSAVMVEASRNSVRTEEEFNDLEAGLRDAGISARFLNESVDRANSALEQVTMSADIADANIDELQASIRNASLASNMADKSVGQMEDAVTDLAASGQLTESQMRRLVSRFVNVSESSQIAQGRVSELSQEFVGAAMAADQASRKQANLAATMGVISSVSATTDQVFEKLGRSIDEVSDEMDGASGSAMALTGNLGILSAVAETTAFEFSSLSVNIGPFNLALRNILTQLPAILTGMSTMIALVASLAGAFITLGVVMGGLFAGGALAFFEDFSEQFEEAGEATEALMGALKDLFTEAMAPLMNEANADMFIDAINMAARAVNEFAQFASQMREPVMEFLSSIDGDFDKTFEAMHDSFIMLQPVLRSFLEFFVNELPAIMVRFSQLTDRISGDIGLMIRSVGALIAELLDFASIVIDLVAPTVAVLLSILTGLFKAFNTLPDLVSEGILAIGALSFVTLLATVKLANLAKSLWAVHAAMMADAASATILSTTYKTLLTELAAVIAGEITLSEALGNTRGELAKNLSAWLSNLSAKIANRTATNAMSVAMIAQIDILKALIAGNMSLTTALKLTVVNMYNLAKAILFTAGAMVKNFLAAIGGVVVGLLSEASAALAASSATWAFVASLAALGAPAWAVGAAIVALVGILVGLVQMFTETDIFAPFIKQVKRAIDWVKSLISHLDFIPGMGGAGDISVADTDDIQTDASVDLSFEDKLEQNVDVQADPEDQAQLSRVTKDAIEEANSFARRQQGGQ